MRRYSNRSPFRLHHQYPVHTSPPPHTCHIPPAHPFLIISNTSKFVSVGTKETRQAMYVWRNIEARSCNCCSVKTINVTYFECEFVALGTQHAMRMRHIFICGLSDFTIFFSHYLIKGTIFEEKKKNINYMFWFSLQLLSEIFLIRRRIKRDIIINVK